MRSIIVDYHQQALSAYDNGLYAASIVLCGGVLEGVLTWAVDKRQREQQQTSGQESRPETDRRKASTSDLTNLRLNELIKKAEDLGVIGKVATPISHSVRNFRNYIYPYKVLGMGSSRANRNIALNVISGVAEVIQSLQGRIIRNADNESVDVAAPIKNKSIEMGKMNFCWLEENRVACSRGPRSNEE